MSANMGSLPIRIKLDLTRLDNLKYSYVWFPIDRRRFSTINDVKTDICKKYELPEERTELFLKGALLREDETVLLLRENDTIQVLYKQLEPERALHRKCGVPQCAGKDKSRKRSLKPSASDSKNFEGEASNSVYGLLYSGLSPSSEEEICMKRKKKKCSSDARYNLDIGCLGDGDNAAVPELATPDHTAVPDVARKVKKKKKKKKHKEEADRTEKMQVMSSFNSSVCMPSSSSKSHDTRDLNVCSNAVPEPCDEDFFTSIIAGVQNTECDTEKLKGRKHSVEKLNRAGAAAEILSTIQEAFKYINDRQPPDYPHTYGMVTDDDDDAKSAVKCSQCHHTGGSATCSVPCISKEDKKKNASKSTGVTELVFSQREHSAREPSSRNSSSLTITAIDPYVFLADRGGGGHKNNRENVEIDSCAGGVIPMDADGCASGISESCRETKVGGNKAETKNSTGQDLHVSAEGEQCFPVDHRHNKGADSSLLLNSSRNSVEMSVTDASGVSLDLSQQSVANGDDSTLANSGNCRKKKKRRRRRKRRTGESCQNIPTVLYARSIETPVEKAIAPEPTIKQGTGMHIRFGDEHDDNDGPENSVPAVELGAVQPQEDTSSKPAVNPITPPQGMTETSKIVVVQHLPVSANTSSSSHETVLLKDPEPVNTQNGVGNKLEEAGEKDYNAYPPLNTVPEVGAVIAFQLLELSELYCPELTDYKEGRVVNVDQSDDTISIELLAEEVKKPKSGKFENVYSSDSEVDMEIVKTISRKFNELIHPKILVPAASV